MVVKGGGVDRRSGGCGGEVVAGENVFVVVEKDFVGGVVEMVGEGVEVVVSILVEHFFFLFVLGRKII